MEKNILWKRDLVEMLLLNYQGHENLYNVRDPNYMNRVKRSESFFKLYEELRLKNNNVRVEGIKAKIHTLRTQYVKELREIAKSKRSGVGLEDVYESKLWCFDQMEFLKPHCATRKSTSNLAFNDEDVNSSSVSSFLEESGQSEHTDSLGDDARKQEDAKTRTSRKRKTKSNREELWKNMQISLVKRLNERSEYEWLGQQVSFDLKNIRNEDVRNETVCKIQSILREAKLADKSTTQVENESEGTSSGFSTMPEVQNPNFASSSRVLFRPVSTFSDNSYSPDILQQSLSDLLEDEDFC